MSPDELDMNAGLSAAKQHLRSLMKQRLAALPQESIREQSRSAEPHEVTAGAEGCI